MADGSRQTGGLFLPRTCVETLRSAADSRFSSTGSFLDVEADHLRLQKRQYGLNEQEVYHLHLRPVLVRELIMLIFDRESKGFMSLRVSRSLTQLGMIRKTRQVKLNLVEHSVGEEYKPKAGHVSLSPSGSNSLVIPEFFICEREK